MSEKEKREGLGEKREEFGDREPHEPYGEAGPSLKGEGAGQELPTPDEDPSNWDPARGAGSRGGRRSEPEDRAGSD